jgi:hypothetical protein
MLYTPKACLYFNTNTYTHTFSKKALFKEFSKKALFKEFSKKSLFKEFSKK